MRSCGNRMFEEFRKLSARIGRNPLLVQGGGGNTSLKEDNLLWIKGSGKWLDKAERENIFVPLDLDALRQALTNANNESPSLYLASNSKLRPSIEATLHAIVPQKVVLHVHSINSIARTVMHGGKQDVSRKLRGLNWKWIPYHRPGVPLTHAINDIITTSSDILVLANHGLVLGADTCSEAESLLDEVEIRLKKSERSAPKSDTETIETLAESAGLRLPKHAIAHSLATDPANVRMATGGALYPDHVVYLGPGTCVVQEGKSVSTAMNDYQARYGISPQWTLVPAKGVAVSKDITPGGEEMLLALALVLNRIRPDARLSFLSDEEVNTLLNWDAEKYRKIIR